MAKKPRLTTLKPRLATLHVGMKKETSADSWRSGKTTTGRGYGYKWQKARDRYLRAHPLCCYCQREGRLGASSIVDHKVPHQGNDTLFWDETNWQPLCKPHHDGTKAAEEREIRRE